MKILKSSPASPIEVLNTGDRDIQVRSHSHFFGVNRALRFNRAAAWGMKLDPPSGMGVRFEPGIAKSVDLVPVDGGRIVLGQSGLTNGPLDAAGAKADALARAKALGFLGA